MLNLKYRELFSKEKIYLGQDKNYFASWEDVPFLRKIILSTPNLKDDYLKSLNDELEKLKKITVWIRAKRTEKVSNLYELYNFFLDSRVRHIWEGSMDNILVSTISKTGVFTHITDLRWYDRNIYKKFITKRLLCNHFISREFRIATNLKCFIDLEENKKKCDLHQITDSGLLFKITDVSLNNLIEGQKKIRFLVPKLTSNCLQKYAFICSYETLVRYNNVKSFRLDHQSECFIFIPFIAMNFEGEYAQDHFIKNISNLLSHFYDTFQTKVYAFREVAANIEFNTIKEKTTLCA